MERTSAAVARRARLAERWAGLGRAASHLVPLAMLVFVALEWNGIPGQDRDTLAYHRAAAAARADGAIYEPLPPPGPHEMTGEWYYLYPPPLAAMVGMVPETSYRTFDRAWLILNVFAFWLLAACLSRIARGAWEARGTALWGAALFFLPGTLLAIHFANIELMILALVALGLALPASGGLMLGLAAAFKVTPVWPLLALATRRPGKTLPGLGAAIILSLSACLLVFGARDTMALVARWVSDVMPTVGQGQFWGESLAALQAGGLGPVDYLVNLSISFLPIQLATMHGWWGYDGGTLPGLVRVYLTAVALGGPLLAMWLTRRRAPNVQVAIVMAAASFAAPIVRPYTLPVLLLVLATLRQERREGGYETRYMVTRSNAAARAAAPTSSRVSSTR